MEVNFIARHSEVTDRFRHYVAEKATKVGHLADNPYELDVTLSKHHAGKGLIGGDRVELTLIGPGPVIRAESDGEDKYAAFDLAMGRLMERLRRAKDRKKIHRGGAHRPLSLHEVSADAFRQVDVIPATPDDIEKVSTGPTHIVSLEGMSGRLDEPVAQTEPDTEDYSPVVIRSKEFTAAPMTLDDALYNMELVGHDFYLYVDKETLRPSVVYRRKGWDYGVIALDSVQ
jgi:ribosomal subunit interface protein